MMASLLAQMIKNLLAMQGTWVQSLGWEDPLEKEMATHSSILTWRIPLTEETGVLQSTGSQRVRHNWATNTFTFHIHMIHSYHWDMRGNSIFHPGPGFKKLVGHLHMVFPICLQKNLIDKTGTQIYHLIWTGMFLGSEHLLSTELILVIAANFT